MGFSLLRIILFASIACSGSLAAAEPTCPYMLVSIPKSGSNLMQKLLFLLSSNTCINTVHLTQLGNDINVFPPFKYARPDLFRPIFAGGELVSLHTHFNFAAIADVLADENPEYRRIAMIRDLRDVAVSLTHFIDGKLQEKVGRRASFEKKLMYVIKARGFLRNGTFNIGLSAKEAIRWMGDPNVLTCRFEALRGTLEEQCAEIKRIEEHLGISLSERKRIAIANQLYGGTITFRKGIPGEWKKCFTPEHKEEFKKRYGPFLIAMGYEKDDNW